jgi:hypothetical protein
MGNVHHATKLILFVHQQLIPMDQWIWHLGSIAEALNVLNAIALHEMLNEKNIIDKLSCFGEFARFYQNDWKGKFSVSWHVD